MALQTCEEILSNIYSDSLKLYIAETSISTTRKYKQNWHGKHKLLKIQKKMLTASLSKIVLDDPMWQLG